MAEQHIKNPFDVAGLSYSLVHEVLDVGQLKALATSLLRAQQRIAHPDLSRDGQRIGRSMDASNAAADLDESLGILRSLRKEYLRTHAYEKQALEHLGQAIRAQETLMEREANSGRLASPALAPLGQSVLNPGPCTIHLFDPVEHSRRSERSTRREQSVAAAEDEVEANRVRKMLTDPDEIDPDIMASVTEDLLAIKRWDVAAIRIKKANKALAKQIEEDEELDLAALADQWAADITEKDVNPRLIRARAKEQQIARNRERLIPELQEQDEPGDELDEMMLPGRMELENEIDLIERCSFKLEVDKDGQIFRIGPEGNREKLEVKLLGVLERESVFTLVHGMGKTLPQSTKRKDWEWVKRFLSEMSLSDFATFVHSLSTTFPEIKGDVSNGSGVSLLGCKQTPSGETVVCLLGEILSIEPQGAKRPGKRPKAKH